MADDVLDSPVDQDEPPRMSDDEIEAARAAASAPPPEPDVWLRIEKGVVTNVETYNGTPPTTTGVTWKQDATAGIGWRYGSSGFKPPPKI